MLEAIVNGRYYWIPFTRLREIQVEKPADLRDVAWTPAPLTFANGGETRGADPDPLSRARRRRPIRALVMARGTEWIEHARRRPSSVSGQRLLATDQGEYALMDVRVIKLDVDHATGETRVAAGLPMA